MREINAQQARQLGELRQRFEQSNLTLSLTKEAIEVMRKGLDQCVCRRPLLLEDVTGYHRLRLSEVRVLSPPW